MSNIATTVLSARGLVVGYGGRPVLEGLDFDLREGEVLCLIGHNGAGKSTLLKAMVGLIPVSAGRIELNGRTIARPSPRALRARSLVPLRVRCRLLPQRRRRAGQCVPVAWAISASSDSCSAGSVTCRRPARMTATRWQRPISSISSEEMTTTAQPWAASLWTRK